MPKIASSSSARFITIIVVLVALVGVGYISNIKSQKKSSTQTVQSAKSVSYQGVEGKSALELLKDKHKVDVQQTSAGAFVTSIDKVKNTNSNFWIYYVNGQQATVGSDQYITKQGEKIEWRYEKFQ